MKRPRLISIFMILMSFFSVTIYWACENSDTSAADIVLWNGNIYPIENKTEQVEAIAIKGERILFTGTYEQIQKYISEETQVVDLQGKTVLPGFTDAHVHPLTSGMALIGCDLSGIENPDSMLNIVKNYTITHPDYQWIRAYNFWLASFPEGNPKKELLDKIEPDRPIYITSSDGHSAWVNSKALDLAGITSETANPAHGVIERDKDTNEPTGTLREEAMSLVEVLIPPPSHEEYMAGLRKGLEVANSYGITNLVEASAKEDHLKAYLDLAEKQELTAHINVSIYCDISKGSEGAQKVLALNRKYKSKLVESRGQIDDLSLDQVKIFMDGVVEGKTAAMLDNYHNDHHSGFLNANRDTAIEVITVLDKAGLQVHVHAIGDLGVRATLDAFEHARKVNGVQDSRHHIAHLHVVHPDDIPRFKELDVIANFQALWATLEDSYTTEFNYPYLGDERSEWQYPIGSIARTGAHMAFGSDWDVSTMDPFDAMQVAITRRGPDNIVREPWTAQHLTDAETVVEGYTKGGAYLTFRDKNIGTLTVGKLADLIIIDKDVMSVSKFDLYQTQVLMTMFRGKVVYGQL